MKFLIDNQLPAALARFLTTHGHDAQHVLDLQLAEAADAALWRQAGFEGRVVVSKDGDFLHFATRPDADGACRQQAAADPLLTPLSRP